MTKTVEVPPGLRVTIWQPDGFTITTAAKILAVSTDKTAYYDGDVVDGEPSTQIRFSFPFSAETTGLDYEQFNDIAAQLAPHLAAHDGDWPTGEAHVRGYPIVDFKRMFQVTPCRTDKREAPSGPLGFLAVLDALGEAGVRQMLSDIGHPVP